MRIGLGVLRLSPEAFWAMTLRELLAAAGSTGGRAAGLSRTDLNDLMRAFPDRIPGS